MSKRTVKFPWKIVSEWGYFSFWLIKRYFHGNATGRAMNIADKRQRKQNNKQIGMKNSRLKSNLYFQGRENGDDKMDKKLQ